jgi:hypothetical protein
LLCLYILALILANKTPDFYKVKGAGIGDRASNEFMKNLRQLAKSHFGSDFSEMRVCKDTKHAFDFYIPEEGSVIEVALSLHNPASEYEKTFSSVCWLRRMGWSSIHCFSYRNRAQ